MTKSLLCGAALAVVLAASAAHAADPTGLEVKISGRLGFLAGVVIDRTDNQNLDRDYDFETGARLQFDVKNVTDSGLEYGARIRFNNVDRKNGVTVDRTYVYLKGGFGTFTFGDAPYIAEDFHVYAQQTLGTNFGLDTDWGNGFRSPGTWLSGSNAFFAVAPYQQFGGLNAKDTKVKYTSPFLLGSSGSTGISVGFDFTPVVGGNGHAGPGGVNDLTNDATTVYENVLGGGLDYRETLGSTSVRLSGMAYEGNGVSGNHDLQAYYLAGQVGFANGFWASASWTHFSSTFHADKAIDSIIGDVSYTTGPWLASIGYAYTTAERDNGLNSSLNDGKDLQTSHNVIGTLVYSVAPGLDAFTELRYEKDEFRQGSDFETTALSVGTILNF